MVCLLWSFDFGSFARTHFRTSMPQQIVLAVVFLLDRQTAWPMVRDLPPFHSAQPHFNKKTLPSFCNAKETWPPFLFCFGNGVSAIYDACEVKTIGGEEREGQCLYNHKAQQQSGA